MVSESGGVSSEATPYVVARSEAEARARIDAQWPLARKRPLVERRIENRGNPEALDDAVRAALQGPPEARTHTPSDQRR